MESNRQKKIAGIIQKDIAELLQSDARGGMKGVIISITKVAVTSDLSQAKIYVSVFPQKDREKVIKGIQAHTGEIRYELAQRTRNQLRRMPELLFYVDDTLDYIETIDNALKGEEVNPIEHPEVLPRRQKR
ncbi:MAG: 30S ribosome-binding factor RbfA [Flavobacteriaceae bacterium]|nr:30S ribosome-binding factor RbfA [Flavobacteriaceae bacterium]